MLNSTQTADLQEMASLPQVLLELQRSVLELLFRTDLCSMDLAHKNIHSFIEPVSIQMQTSHASQLRFGVTHQPLVTSTLFQPELCHYIHSLTVEEEGFDEPDSD